MSNQRRRTTSIRDVQLARLGYSAPSSGVDFEEHFQKFHKLKDAAINSISDSFAPDFDDVTVLLEKQLLKEKIDAFMDEANVKEEKHNSSTRLLRKRRKNECSLARRVSGSLIRSSSWFRKAHSVPVPKYAHLTKNWEAIRDKRKHKKGVKSRLETNALTRVRQTQMDFNAALNAKEKDQIKDDAVLISISIFGSNQSTMHTKRVKEVTFAMSAKLKDLQKHVDCILPHHSQKDPMRRGCAFFINDTLWTDGYADSPNVIDRITSKIAKRLSGPRAHLTNIDVRDMDICLGELRIRLGQFCFYIHNGNCIHTICFTDMRGANKKDLCYHYPRVTFEAVKKVRSCQACDIGRPASYCTYDDPTLSSDPFLWCYSCYQQYNFKTDEDIKKQWKALPGRTVPYSHD